MTVWCALTLLVGVAAAAADAADGGRSRQPVSVAGSGEVARNALTTTPASADVVGAASSSASDDQSTASESPTTAERSSSSVGSRWAASRNSLTPGLRQSHAPDSWGQW